MSYEDTHCPCGDKKPTNTMFCDACVAYLSDRAETKVVMRDPDADTGMRRHCALVLVSLSHGRKRRQALDAERTLKANKKLKPMVFHVVFSDLFARQPIARAKPFVPLLHRSTTNQHHLHQFHLPPPSKTRQAILQAICPLR